MSTRFILTSVALAAAITVAANSQAADTALASSAGVQGNPALAHTIARNAAAQQRVAADLSRGRLSPQEAADLQTQVANIYRAQAGTLETAAAHPAQLAASGQRLTSALHDAEAARRSDAHADRLDRMHLHVAALRDAEQQRWIAQGLRSGHLSPTQAAQLERTHQWQHATQLMEAGVTLADPARIDVRGSLACGADVHIDVNCVFEGDVKLADQVVVSANCVLRNTEVGAGTRIEPFTYIDAARIGANCRIGPYARFRPGVRLAEEVHVGNFVEVKASRLGRGSKANHLAYIGDAEVGRRVNVGAGTITCNYDGARKHRTVIEDDCFIGSDATLVAPVRIRKGSYIGAGSTISKSTPPGQLTVARAKQVTVPGWKPPRKK